MNTRNEQHLFRQQVIDEFNSKLNGEVILHSAYSMPLLAMIFIWILMGVITFTLVKIDFSESATGVLSYDKHDNLVANFSISPDLVDEFHPEKIIDVRLHNISSETVVILPIKIVGVDNKLISSASQRTMVNVNAIAQLDEVIVNKRPFKLTQGIVFSFSVASKKISLFAWIKERYFSGEKYGY